MHGTLPEMPLGEIRCLEDLRRVLGTRIEQLGISYETADEIAGLSARYCSKILGPHPSRRLGHVAFGALLGALGIKLVAVVDEPQMTRVQSRLIQRRRRHHTHWHRTRTSPRSNAN